MADSNVSNINSYYSKETINENNETYQNSNTYNYNKNNQMTQNTSYNYKQNVSNEFVGDYNQYNAQIGDTASGVQYQQVYVSGQYVGYQMPVTQSAYPVSTQYQNYSLNSGYTQAYQNPNLGSQVQGYNYPDSQPNYDTHQVNSQNFYSKTDDTFNDTKPGLVDEKSNTHQSGDQDSTNHLKLSEDYLEHDKQEKPGPQESDSSSGSENSSYSYRRHRRSHRRSRSRDRKHRRRSRSHRHRSRSRSRVKSRSRRHRSRSRSRERTKSSHRRRHRSRSRDSHRDDRRRRERSPDKFDNNNVDKSRSRDRYRRTKSRSVSHRLRSRDRDMYRRSRHRSRSRDRSRTPRSKNVDHNNDNVMNDVLEKAQMLRSSEMEKRRLKDIEEAQRDDLTILVANMNLAADEKDIYELFSEHAGKVRDIQLVRDSRSGRSKGIAYVEFYTQEAVIKALSLTGMSLKGQGIRVQSSQAEKNRAARAAKQLQDSALKESDNPTTILVSNLVGVLSNIGETDLQQLFAPFGNIVDVAVARNDLGQSKGYAYIKFKKWNEAKEALNVMNGFDVSGQQLKVAYATTKKDSKSRLHSLGDLDIERIDDDDAGLISGSSNKIALMKKLQERQPANSSNLVLSNMYSEQDYEDSQEFFEEIEEDVREECSKYGSVVQVYLNRKKPDGKVYVKFRNYIDAQNANKSLQGRYFAGNTIQVNYLSDEQFLSLTNK